MAMRDSVLISRLNNFSISSIASPPRDEPANPAMDPAMPFPREPRGSRLEVELDLQHDIKPVRGRDRWLTRVRTHPERSPRIPLPAAAIVPEARPSMALFLMVVPRLLSVSLASLPAMLPKIEGSRLEEVELEEGSMAVKSELRVNARA